MESKILNINGYDEIVDLCRNIAILKNSLYGNENLIRFGDFGILVRMNDKIGRLNNLINKNNGKTESKDIIESVEDTLKDLINYAIYMILIRKNKLVIDDGKKE